MIRRLCLFGLIAMITKIALLVPASADAQDVPRPQVPRIPFPKIEGLPADLQRDLEFLQRALELQQQALRQQGLQRREFAGNAGQVSWGGMRLTKVTAALQEELGLPENEGLVVAGVDANSQADRAGLKLNDVVVKINNKAVPNDAAGFAKLVKDQNATDPMDLVVVRNGKEETIKGARMPVLVQAAPNGGFGGRGAGGAGGFGGIIIPRINIDPRAPNPVIPNFPNPFRQGTIQNLQLDMTIDGAKISRKQTEDQFSGEYAKDGLKVSVTGKIQNGQAAPTEITVQDGRETKKYTKLNDVPAQFRAPLQQLMPTVGNALPFQGLQGLPGFPGLDDLRR